VVEKVKSQQHRGVSPNVAVTWARRLVTTDRLLRLKEQRALLELLGELPPGET